MAAKVTTVWPRFVGDAGAPPTYRVVLDGMEMPTIYMERNKAKAMADQYNAAADSNAHDIYSQAS